MTATLGSGYRSELLRKVAAEHEARGEAQAVLAVLDARGVGVPDAIRELILACTDLAQLGTWLRRVATAATAATAAEVVRT